MHYCCRAAAGAYTHAALGCINRQSREVVKLPLAAYSVDGENAAVGAWMLLEPIKGVSNELEEECGGDQGRRTSSRARTPNVRNIDQLG